MNNDVEHPPQHHPSVAEQLGSSHVPPQAAPPGRIFVFVPFHPVGAVNSHLSSVNFQPPSANSQPPSVNSQPSSVNSDQPKMKGWDGLSPALLTQEKFEEKMKEAQDDGNDLVHWWKSQFREGMQMLKEQLSPEELQGFENKIPEVVVMGDKWSDASQQLLKAGKNDTVYVVGHSNVGQPTLKGREDRFFSITPEQLLHRMELQGIPQTIGKVKIFACFGAADAQSFVPKFVTVSRDKQKYSDARITGYTDKVANNGEFKLLKRNMEEQKNFAGFAAKEIASLNEHLKDDMQVVPGGQSADDLPKEISPDMLHNAQSLQQANASLQHAKESVGKALHMESKVNTQVSRLRAGLSNSRIPLKVGSELADGTRAPASSCAMDYAPGAKVGTPRAPKPAITLH